MKKRFKLFLKSIIGMIIGVGILLGCQNEENIITPKEEVEVESFTPEGQKIILGKQLENPYSVENMRKALANLKANGRVAGNFDITITNLYVRFLPADSTDLEALERDTTLSLYDHPLDFEIEENGHWYHDPKIPNHKPTYQYTVVKPDFVFPDRVQHEVLANLFLPEEIEDEAESGQLSIDIAFLRELEDEALRMTDNWEDPIKISKNAKKYYPKGRIMVRERVGNSNLRWLPVKYVRVRTRRWYSIRTEYTDVKGYYKFRKKFRRKVNYSIVWRTSDVNITNWLGWATRYNGPKKKYSWNPYFDWHSESWVRATLINATAEYDVQRKITGIKDFDKSGIYGRLNIRAIFKKGTGNFFVIRANRIKIFSKYSDGSNRTGNKDTRDLYRVTFHELGHQSHWKLNRYNMPLCKNIVRESWAAYIEHLFIEQYYLGTNSHMQTKDRNKMNDGDGYSAVFIDLADDENQRFTNSGSTAFPDDDVEGYTSEQLQSTLRYARKLEHVRDYLTRHYDNTTDQHLDKLFDFYIDIQ